MPLRVHSHPGPETVDRSIIGTTRRFNAETNTIEWVCAPQHKHTPAPPDGRENVIYRLCSEREAGRLIFQVGTSDPERAVAAARIVAADVAGIDVNAGCPKPFSTHDGMGAALLRTPDKLVAILEALVREIAPEFEVGISVKIRLLETAAETEALVRRLVATGITGLTVHCRTTPMRPREPAIRGQLRMIAGVCREAGVACLVNGDVKDRDSAARLVDEYGVDGAMIAVCAEKNSSCFRSAADGGLAPWDEVAAEYVRLAMEVRNKFGNTKYLLSQIIPGKAPQYRAVNAGKCYAAVCEALGLQNLVGEARELDDILGISPAAKSAGGKGKRNSVALAAGGNMSEARSSSSRNRRGLAERAVTSKAEVSLPEAPQSGAPQSGDPQPGAVAIAI